MNASKSKKGGALRAAREAMYRSHILDVAEGLFADQGYAQTRMQDIAQAAEISLTTVYQMFPGKQDLYRQILVERDQAMFARVMHNGAAAIPSAGGIAQVLRLLASQVGFLLEHPNYLRMQLQDGRLWFHSESRPSASEQQMWAQGMELMAQLFRWGIGAGLFCPGEPAELGRMLLALQQTRLANWVLAGMQAPHARVIGEIQSDFVRFFCQPKVAAGFLNEEGNECLLINGGRD